MRRQSPGARVALGVTLLSLKTKNIIPSVVTNLTAAAAPSGFTLGLNLGERALHFVLGFQGW
jgi:hypothetical protein